MTALRIVVVFGVATLLAGCASESKFACGMPEGHTCMSATEVYKNDILHEKVSTPDNQNAHAEDGEKLTPADKMDRSFHNFAGSVQSHTVDSLTAMPLVRQPVYRTLYFPAKVAHTRDGRPFEILPHVVVVEQIPGGFTFGESPEETVRTQMVLPWMGGK